MLDISQDSEAEMKTPGERERKDRGEGSELIKGLCCGDKAERQPGEAGLTNPSHSSSPGIWSAHSAHRKLLKLTRFQVISLLFTLSPVTNKTGSSLMLLSGLSEVRLNIRASGLTDIQVENFKDLTVCHNYKY